MAVTYQLDLNGIGTRFDANLRSLSHLLRSTSPDILSDINPVSTHTDYLRSLENTPILSIEPDFTAANLGESLFIVGPPCLSDGAYGESLGLSERIESCVVTTHPLDRYKQEMHRHELIALGLPSPSFSDAQHGRSMFERSFAPSASSESVHTKAVASRTLSQATAQPERIYRQGTKPASPMSRYLQSAHDHEHLAVQLCDSQPFEPALSPRPDEGSPISSISLTVAPSILMNHPLISGMKRPFDVDDCADEATWESDYELLREQVRLESRLRQMNRSRVNSKGTLRAKRIRTKSQDKRSP